MNKENIITLAKIIGELNAIINDNEYPNGNQLGIWQEAIEKVLEDEKE